MTRHLLTLAAYCVLVYFSTGCLRDYSYEGGPVPDSTLNDPGSPSTSGPKIYCPACQAPALPDSSWRFETPDGVFCGAVIGAVITPDRTAFTFFGPSSCSADSGLIMTIYLNQALDHDAGNIVTEKIVLQYYDNITPGYMLQSKPIPGFTFVIDQYIHQTGTARGHFSGHVFSANGQIVDIRQGEYRFRFR